MASYARMNFGMFGGEEVRVARSRFRLKNHSKSSIIVPKLYCFVFISKGDNE